MLTKYAEAERTLEVLDAFAVPENAGHRRLARLRRRAHRHHFEYSPRPGYIYVRSRAISSRCNDNFDEFPAPEIKKAYRTFIGKPVFVNHHNSDHRRARGVIIDAALHEDTNPDGSEDVWAEVLMEVDAKRFPVLAREVIAGNIARTSMGTDVEYSVCTACGNKAYTPADYCQHIPKLKGMKIKRFNAATGGHEEVLIAERCYGLRFFENSLLVEDPADPTAFGWLDAVGEGVPGLSAAAARQVIDEAEGIVRSASKTAFPSRRDMEDELAGRKPRYQQQGHEDPANRQHPTRKPPARNRPKPHDVWSRMSDEEYEGWREKRDSAAPDGSRPAIEMPGDDRSKQRRGPVQALLDEWDTFSSKQAVQVCLFDGEPLETPEEVAEHAGHGVIDMPWLDSKYSPEIEKAAARTTRPPGRAKRAGMFDYFEVIVHHRGDEVPVVEHRTPDLLEAIAYAKTIWEGEKPILCVVDNAGTDTCFWQNGENTTSGRFASRQAAYGDDPEMQAWYKARENVTYTDGTRVQEGDRIRFHQAPGGLMQPGDWRYGVAAYMPGETRRNKELLLRDESGRYYNLYGHVVERADKTSSRHVHSYGETKAPAKVDTMRAENCPVCGDDEGYNGDKCSVCGYMQPPSQFQDPDLTKAREQDLRQEQTGLPDPAAVGEGLEDPAPTDPLQCTNCGEVFSAEGEPAPDTDPAAEAEEKEADPEHPDDPEDSDSKTPGEPDDLSDLADATDEDLFGDDDEEDDDEEVEPEDPTTTDPAVGEGRITAEPADGDKDLGDIEIAPNMTCPVCGEGTLVPQAGQESEGAEPKIKEVGTDPTKAKERVAMTNPAQQRRNRIIEAIREQQSTIQSQARALEMQDAQIGSLTRAVATLAVAAGVGNHPRFAGLVRQAGLKVADSDTNQGDSIGGSPATSTEEARKPDATDDVNSVGAAPGSANKGVTPEGVTDVNNSDVVANPPVLDNLQDPTKPVSGTDAVDPRASDQGANRVTVGTPSNEPFDKPGDSGWKSSSKESEQERFVASMRLARLRIQAGLEEGEDLALAQRIAASDQPLGEITAQVNALAAVASKQVVNRDETRHLVPRAAARQGVTPVGRTAPSLQAQASGEAARTGEDEWMVGSVD